MNSKKANFLDESKRFAESQAIVQLVDLMVNYAFDEGVSDVHIAPSEGDLRVRMRIDGVLEDIVELPKLAQNEIISRIKVLSGLRTDEHSAPQDGRFRINTKNGKIVDVRVSIVPTFYGENAVLRLLSDHAESYTLERLGFSKVDQEKILNAVRKPSGMILATGPTGSGKTTTLYTLIKMLNTKDISIITIEDPIEYSVSGIEQIQVNSKYGLSFAQGLRSILRQDPNIIMVGEIRDTETAGIAVNTALTGHLLLSTLHTNDAATTLPRLLDMHIEPYLVASTVSVAIGQRLVRRLCSSCKKEYKASDGDLETIKKFYPVSDKKISTLFEAVGCEECGGNGFKGRVGVNEVLVMDEEIRDAIIQKASSAKIKNIAVKNGMTTMLVDGIEKAIRGETTLGEVIRVLYE